jgi:hypothetical protein
MYNNQQFFSAISKNSFLNLLEDKVGKPPRIVGVFFRELPQKDLLFTVILWLAIEWHIGALLSVLNFFIVGVLNHCQLFYDYHEPLYYL